MSHSFWLNNVQRKRERVVVDVAVSQVGAINSEDNGMFLLLHLLAD